VSLTEEGQKYLEKEVGDRVPFDFQCNHCAGKGYLVEASGQDFLKRYNKILEKRPPPEENYDQVNLSDHYMYCD